jgi:hypothetical protein
MPARRGFRCPVGILGRLERRIAELTAEHPRRDRWFTVPEAVAYDMAGEVIDGPAGAPESGTPA